MQEQAWVAQRSWWELCKVWLGGAGCVDRRSYEVVKGRNHSVEEAINTHSAQIRCNQPATVCCVDREVR